MIMSRYITSRGIVIPLSKSPADKKQSPQCAFAVDNLQICAREKASPTVVPCEHGIRLLEGVMQVQSAS